jgi:HlyD family secretion protein
VGVGAGGTAGHLLGRPALGDTARADARDTAGVRSAEARRKDLESGSRASEIDAARADVNEKRAAVTLAEKELSRRAELLQKKVGSQEEYDRARAERDRAAAALKASSERLDLAREGFRRWQTEQARTEVSRAESVLKQSESVAREAEIRAPADGVVLHRIAEPGLLLGPSQPGIVMAFADRLFVRVFVPETKLGKVKQGQAAEVSVDSFPGKTFPAKVTEISPDPEFTPKQVETKTERVNLFYGAKVDLEKGWQEPLVPGQPATVIIRIP